MPEGEFSTFHLETDDGLRLYGREYGRQNAQKPPIVCLPGLSRNSRDFHQLASQLANQGRRAITLDSRGRGLSQWDDNKANYNIVREAQDVIALLNWLGIDRAVFIGTSRGGLILHVLGALAPQRIAAMVINDIGPVIEIDGLRRIRDYLGIRGPLTTLAEAAEHLKTIHGEEFTSLSDRDWLEMAYAIYRESDGTVSPDFDPALVEPLKTMDFSQPLPDMWQQYDLLSAVPMLIIRGENSRLLSEATVTEMRRRHSQAEAIVAEGQGHAPLLHLADISNAIETFLLAH